MGVQNAIMANVTVVPMIITAVTLVFLFFYPITEEYGKKMRAELAERRKNGR
ncbi:MAG TPA: hypothetical protein IAA17_07315 [Candidatus Lachnoclostridium stercorigallinarum]|uniref:Uncharacterized protein n=1 Tax=Candidatus Lachnoclostridium stercorigallinarum TaxID=2838634 RepID=A0A9D2GH26_9FIRM|nr:hypothetical protein [Candidatus Lachnoclostridium stercorigallinarum]